MSPIHYETICEKHGKQEASIKAYPHKSLVVGTPLNKRERLRSGCPICKKESRENANVNNHET